MKVIISLTTISARLENIHLTLESLQNQDYPDFEVRIYTSHEPFLIDDGVSKPPESVREILKSDPRIRWFSTKNIGPYRKILPVLAELSFGNYMIATADDDTVYPVDWLSDLMHYWNRHKCIIARRGHRMLIKDGYFVPYRKWMGKTSSENPSIFWLPTGKDGVLYNAMYFKKEILRYERALELAKTADDLWIKWHSALNSVPVFVINQDYRSGTLEDTNTGSSLYKEYNEKGGNDIVIQNLEDYAEKTFGRRLCDLSRSLT